MLSLSALRGRDARAGFAVAGTVISVLGIVLWLPVIVIALAGGGNRAIEAQAPGSVDDVEAAGPAAALPTSAAATDVWTLVDVVDGDTVDVMHDGLPETIRLIGIDAPERGHCGYEEAAARLSEQARNGFGVGFDGSPERDGHGRLLAYLTGTDRSDAGLAVIRAGLAVARYDSRDGYRHHPLEETYVAADAASPDVSCPDAVSDVPSPPSPATTAPRRTTSAPPPTTAPGPTTATSSAAPPRTVPPATAPATLTTAAPPAPATTVVPPAPPPPPPPLPSTVPPVPTTEPLPVVDPPPAATCDPSYPGVCIPPGPSDLDCGDVSYRRFEVRPPDPHGFDGDHDGVGCESG